MDNTYPTDKVIGILVIVFSVCAAIGGLLIVLGGGILGAAGVAGATQAREAGGAAVAAGAGGMLVVIGLLTALISAVRIYGGIKMMQSIRSGFMIVMILSLIGVVLSLLSFNAASIVQLAINGALAYYCWARMNGKIGPPLLD